jgi:phenylacetate-CoA ligase
MNEKEKEILIGNLSNSLPREINLKNLLGNDVFISWFLPRLKLIKEIQRWSQEKINELTEIRLRNLFNHLNSHSQFWCTYFSKYFVNFESTNIFAELMKLPFTNKTNIIEWGDTYLISNNDLKATDYYTSGTTGPPLRIRIDESGSIRNELVYTFESDVFEIGQVNKLLRRKFVLLLGRKSTGIWVPYSEHFPLDAFSALSNKETRQVIYNKILNNSYIYLFAYSSITLELMKYAKEDGVSLPIIAHLSGEGISSEEERFIYKTTGVPITFQYNCKEAGSIGAKCVVNIGENLYHIYRERVIVEIVDDDYQQLEDDKVGNIVLTVLDRTVMPIIRYSTGDRGRILSRLCSCGRLSPLLELWGRKKDVLLFSNGKTFSVILFQTLFVKEIGLENIARYQIIQRKLDDIQINYIARAKISLEKIKFIEMILENTLRNEAQVMLKEISVLESYTSGKNKVFISLEEYKLGQKD